MIVIEGTAFPLNFKRKEIKEMKVFRVKAENLLSAFEKVNFYLTI